MSTLSVPQTKESEAALRNLINCGFADNKAEAARRAILQAEEDAAVSVVLESQQCVREGKILKGSLRNVIKKI
jgi:hypothetical protein